MRNSFDSYTQHQKPANFVRSARIREYYNFRGPLGHSSPVRWYAIVAAMLQICHRDWRWSEWEWIDSCWFPKKSIESLSKRTKGENWLKIQFEFHLRRFERGRSHKWLESRRVYWSREMKWKTSWCSDAQFSGSIVFHRHLSPVDSSTWLKTLIENWECTYDCGHTEKPWSHVIEKQFKQKSRLVMCSLLARLSMIFTGPTLSHKRDTHKKSEWVAWNQIMIVIRWNWPNEPCYKEIECGDSECFLCFCARSRHATAASS